MERPKEQNTKSEKLAIIKECGIKGVLTPLKSTVSKRLPII
jgi:hypothetical protein